VERGANVRLIRDNVVIHEGKLAQLKRFKERRQGRVERHGVRHVVRELSDLRPDDVIECYRVEIHSALAVSPNLARPAE